MDELVAKVGPTLRGLRKTKCLEERSRMFAIKVGNGERGEAQMNSLVPAEVIRSKQMLMEFIVWSVCWRKQGNQRQSLI